MKKILIKLYWYIVKLWYQYFVCDAFLITFANSLELGEVLTTTYGDKIEVLWEKEMYRQDYRTYWKYWVINV